MIDKHICIYDHGNYSWIAQVLTKHFKKVSYFCFHEGSYPRSNVSWIGQNIEGVEWVDEFFEEVKDFDIIFFPDCRDADLQEFLRSLGKDVFGSFYGTELELMRYETNEHLEEIGLPKVKMDRVVGVDNLREYLDKNENIYVKSNFRGDCFDDKTEIFTRDGWKLFKDVKYTDDILTLDLQSRRSEFAKPSNIISYHYDGEMYQIKTKKIDALVTPNHHFFINRSDNKKCWKYLPINQIKSKSFSVPVIFEWHGESVDKKIVPAVDSFTRVQKEKVFDMNLWLDFLGWFISEGNINTIGGVKYRITINQSKIKNKEKYDKIEDTLKKLGYNYQIEGNVGFSIYDKSLYFELLKSCYPDGECSVCGKTKCSHTIRVPKYVKQLSTEQIKIFLNSYGLGDGSCSRGEMRYYSSSYGLIEDVFELVSKSGNSASIHLDCEAGVVGGHVNGRDIIARANTYYVSALKTKDSIIDQKNISKVHYSGIVYDVTIDPHHTIFVRRNNKAFWSGNCETWHSENYKLSEPMLDTLEQELGMLKNDYEFLCCHAIDGEDVVETGFDTYNIDGEWPEKVMVGIEIKDLGYFGTVKKLANVSKSISQTLTKFSDTLKEYKYRNFYSNEIRIGKDKKPYVTDSTCRCPAPPADLYFRMLDNLGEIISEGSKGIMVQPKYKAKYGLQAIITSDWAEKHWQPIIIDDKVKDYISVKNLSVIDGINYYIPINDIEMSQIGAVVGWGDTPDEALKMLQKNAEGVKGYGIKVNTSSIDSALKEVQKARKIGIFI